MRSSIPRAAADNALGYRPRPLVELRLPLECYPAIPTRPPQRPGPLMGSWSLQHIRNPRSTSRGPSQPATFRLQGLATLLTVYALESRAGFVSHRRRSWDSPFGGFLSRQESAAFRPGRTCISLAQRYLRRLRVRPARRASISRFTPARIALSPRGVLGRRPLAPPLGFSPLGFAGKGLVPGFPGTPPACLACPDDHSPGQPAPRSVNRPSPRIAQPIPEYRPADATLVGFLHLPDPDHSSYLPAPGLWSSPLAQVLHYCRPTGGLWAPAKPCRSWSGSALGAEHLRFSRVAFRHCPI
jgi:hypothetical protein